VRRWHQLWLLWRLPRILQPSNQRRCRWASSCCASDLCSGIQSSQRCRHSPAMLACLAHVQSSCAVPDGAQHKRLCGAVVYLMLANQLIHEIYPDAITVAEDVSGGALGCTTWHPLPAASDATAPTSAALVLKPTSSTPTCRHAGAVPPRVGGRRGL
jgi:hypothetical protein